MAHKAMDPVDLIREPDLRLGPLSVRPSLRQASWDSGSESLEPRVMQVLIALYQRRGEVVSRDELIERCWNGRIVGEDAVTRIIVRLRKLGEASGAFGVETISRVGYRLLLADSAAPVSAPATNAASSAVSSPRPRRLSLLIGAAGTLLILLVTLAVWPRAALEPAAIDALIGRLADRASVVGIADSQREQIGEAIRSLSAGGMRERSVFAALMSGDGVRALDLLEELARGLEQSGQREAAAEVYTRVGAIALVVDVPRGMTARRKALSLAPESLHAFQGLLFDLLASGNSAGLEQFVAGMLASEPLSQRMRAWVLTHRGLYEVDRMMPDMDAAQATLAEVEAIRRRSDDPVVEYSWRWLQSLIAFNRDDFRAMATHLDAAEAIWRNLPTAGRIQDMAEIGRLRALYASGDWASTLESGAAMLSRRSSKGEFLPLPVIIATCMAGIHARRVDAAEPFCLSMTRHTGQVTSSIGILPQVYSSVLKAARGDEPGARLDLDAAKVALGPAASTGYTLAPSILMAEAYLARSRGNLDEARRLVQQAVQLARGPPGRTTWRSFSANGAQLLAEWLIAAGRAVDACEPLAEANRLYAETGADGAAAAMQALRGSAGCRVQ